MRLLANVCLLRLIKTNLVPRPDSSQGEINPADISRLHANGSRQLILTFLFFFFFFITVDVRVSLRTPRLISRGPEVNDRVNLQ